MNSKRLEALQIHRDGDAHVVEHHHTAHPPETHRFKERNQAVGHILTHIERLEPQGSQIEEQEEAQPDLMGGRPARFDHGSSRTSEIEGE